MKEPFTLEELAQIEARYKASSASSRSYDENVWQVSTEIDDGWLVASLGSGPGATETDKDENYYVVTKGVHASELRGDAKADAEFIANAPRDIRRLALAYAQLLNENFELREQIDRFRDETFQRLGPDDRR